MKKAFITGITGQTGSFLCELLLERGYQVDGVIRRSSNFNTGRIDHLYNDCNLNLHYGDMTDATGLYKLINDIKPDFVFNMAAQSHVKVSFLQPVYTVDANALGTMKLLEAVKDVGRNKEIRFYNAASSEMFGSTPPPQNEKTLFHPRSPYACAKVYAYWQTINYREAYDLFAYNGIVFNHESHRRGENFVTRKITRALTRIKLGLQRKLVLGNLDAKRDWSYAKDIAEGIIKIILHDTPDDFVLSTGKSYSVRDWLDICAKHMELDWHDFVEIDEKYMRPSEVSNLCGDSSKANKVLNWYPKTDIHGLARIMLNYDMELARKEQTKIG